MQSGNVERGTGMVEKTRVVIIAHPDFQGGAEGIKEAKDFALNLINGQKHMIDAAAKSGEPAEKT